MQLNVFSNNNDDCRPSLVTGIITASILCHKNPNLLHHGKQICRLNSRPPPSTAFVLVKVKYLQGFLTQSFWNMGPWNRFLSDDVVEIPQLEAHIRLLAWGQIPPVSSTVRLMDWLWSFQNKVNYVRLEVQSYSHFLKTELLSRAEIKLTGWSLEPKNPISFW